jgi:hypothetical protein
MFSGTCICSDTVSIPTYGGLPKCEASLTCSSHQSVFTGLQLGPWRRSQSIRIGPGTHAPTDRDKDWLGCGEKTGDQVSMAQNVHAYRPHHHVRFPDFLIYIFSFCSKWTQSDPAVYMVYPDPAVPGQHGTVTRGFTGLKGLIRSDFRS